MNNQENTKKTLRLKELLPFDETIKSSLTTTFDLAKTVNELFSTAWDDYEGCLITPVNNGLSLSCTLYFKYKQGAQMEPIDGGRQPGTPIASRIQSLNLRGKNRTFKLSSEVYEILSDFVNVGMKKQINWDSLTTEVAEKTMTGQNIYMVVGGIDINKLLRVLYGAKEGGSFVDYNVNIIRPVSQAATIEGTNFMIMIQRLNGGAMERLAKQIGIMPTTGQVQMIRS